MLTFKFSDFSPVWPHVWTCKSVSFLADPIFLRFKTRQSLRTPLDRGSFLTGLYLYKSVRIVQYLFKEKTTIREIDPL